MLSGASAGLVMCGDDDVVKQHVCMCGNGGVGGKCMCSHGGGKGNVYMYVW